MFPLVNTSKHFFKAERNFHFHFITFTHPLGCLLLTLLLFVHCAAVNCAIRFLLVTLFIYHQIETMLSTYTSTFYALFHFTHRIITCVFSLKAKNCQKRKLKNAVKHEAHVMCVLKWFVEALCKLSNRYIKWRFIKPWTQIIFQSLVDGRIFSLNFDDRFQSISIAPLFLISQKQESILFVVCFLIEWSNLKHLFSNQRNYPWWTFFFVYCYQQNRIIINFEFFILFDRYTMVSLSCLVSFYRPDTCCDF